MPRRKQPAPKRLKGALGKDTEEDSKDDDSQDEEMDEADGDENEDDRSPLSPTASWSVKFTPHGSTTEKVMGTSIPAGSPSVTKVHSKGTWYPDESDGPLECSNPVMDSSFSEGEQEKPKKSATSKKHKSKESQKDTTKEGKAERKTERKKKRKVSRDMSKDSEPECHDAQHFQSSVIRENLRHYFLDKLKSSGDFSPPEEGSKRRKLPPEDGYSGETPRTSSSGHHSRESYTHTVLWKPPADVRRSPEQSSHVPATSMDKMYVRHARQSNTSNLHDKEGTSSDELYGSSARSTQSGFGMAASTTRPSPSRSSEPDRQKKAQSYGSDESAEASLTGSLSPSEYYHHAAAGMGYYPSPFMGYGLYPSYPNLVYPYNYGYVVAVPGGLFIPMGGHSSYTPSSSGERGSGERGSGERDSPSDAPHKEAAPLDLSSCSSTKKQTVEVKPKIKQEEPAEPSSSGKNSSNTCKPESTLKKKKGEKTIVLWKKVPRHAMMMDVAQLSVLEKVHVLYTTESTFLCFICSDCNALFNSLDLLVLHAVGTAHTSKEDIDVKAMGMKGFEVIPMDKIAKKQKHVDKKPDFSFESPLQSTVSLHRRRMPGSKECIAKNRDVYKCSVCPDTFPDFLRYTMHMNETGHRRKSVRYADVYKAQKQVKKILKCMNCEKSFMTLEELTMHMIKTKHYSDIAGGFVNQSEAEEDADFDNLCPPEDNQSLDYRIPVDERTKKLPQRRHVPDGTSSESESPRSLMDSPLGHWRAHARLEETRKAHSPPRNASGGTDRHSKSVSGSKHRIPNGITSSAGSFLPASSDRLDSVAGPSHSGTAIPVLPLPRHKRDMGHRQDETGGDIHPKRIKVEAESEAEDEDQNFAGYESENEFEEEEDVDSFDPEYSFRLFRNLYSRVGDAEDSTSTSMSELRRKYGSRLYKHSLLYRSRGQDLEPKEGTSAFDGLYKWAESLGLLSSPSVPLGSRTPPVQPKAVVKCDSKYVDPDNFDVTLPYGGKVRPDANPLSKLSSMVETTQSKQPKNNSFESNFIMNKAYSNFEKTQRYSTPSPSALNSSFRSEEGATVGETRPPLNAVDARRNVEGPQQGSQHLDGTISQDAVLERLIIKAYDRPMRSVFAERKDDEFCTCTVNSQGGPTNEYPGKTLIPNTRNEDESCCHPGTSSNSCEVCISKEEGPSSRKSHLPRGCEKERMKGVSGVNNEEAGQSSEGQGRSGVVGHEAHSSNGPSSRQFFSAAGREHLQGLIDSPNTQREPMREVKFTWADAIDTLISRSFGAEGELPGPNLSLSERIGMRLQGRTPGDDTSRAEEESRDDRLTQPGSPADNSTHHKIHESQENPQEDEKSKVRNAVVKREDKQNSTNKSSEHGSESFRESGSRRYRDNDESCKGNDEIRKEDGSKLVTPKGKEDDLVNPQQREVKASEGGGGIRGEHVKSKSEDTMIIRMSCSSEKETELSGEDISRMPEENDSQKVEEKFDGESSRLSSASSPGNVKEPSGVDDIPVGERSPGHRVSVKLEEVDENSSYMMGQHSSEMMDDRTRGGSQPVNSGKVLSENSPGRLGKEMVQADGKLTQSPSKRDEPPRAAQCGRTENSPSHGCSDSDRLDAGKCRHGDNKFLPEQQAKNSPATVNRPVGFFRCGSPPPLIPSTDASTKAIQRLEELTRKPAVTNVKEMILSKIHEEVERLIGPSGSERHTTFPHPHVPPTVQYMIPRAENNNESDSSDKSLKSLEELSKRAPSSPYQGVHSAPRARLNCEQPLGRSNPGFRYLLPSSVPESKVSAIQSLEKLSTEHPVLQRKQRAKSSDKENPRVPVQCPAENVQYLPPSFGYESADANSIRSLERFSSRLSFFPFNSHDRSHSRKQMERQNELQQKMSKLGKEAAHKRVSGSPRESPLVVSLPKLEPLSPEDDAAQETLAVKVKIEPSEQENRLEDGEDNPAKVPTSSKDPLMALDNLVTKKQATEVTPSPRKVAWEIVNEDLKPPIYILPPDAGDSQASKNPLEEMDKMMKFP